MHRLELILKYILSACLEQFKKTAAILSLIQKQTPLFLAYQDRADGIKIKRRSKCFRTPLDKCALIEISFFSQATFFSLLLFEIKLFKYN